MSGPIFFFCAAVWFPGVAAWVILTIVRPTIWRAASRALQPASKLGTVVMCLCIFSPMVGSLLRRVWEPLRESGGSHLFELPLLAWAWWVVIYGLRHLPATSVD